MRVDAMRATIDDNRFLGEDAALQALVTQAALSPQERAAICAEAAKLIADIRAHSDPSLMEQFLGEYGLTTQEGIALMSLAEALLRVPDAYTIDALIEDKIAPANWRAHIGAASSGLVNASTWALMFTGKVLTREEQRGLPPVMHGLVRRLGEPVIRTAVARAMREMGRQFVLGTTIADAFRRGKPFAAKGYRFSFDMLGEQAMTDADAQRYTRAYADAITAIAKEATGGPRAAPGISVKLSALHPRYETTKRPQMFGTLVARLKGLVAQAAAADIGFNIDAEEADRLDLSLDVIEAVLSDPDLAGWDGFGVVVQAYSRRAPFVLDWLHALATRLDRRIMVRLVKGAYWDTEIKRAQVNGVEDFPVFTRKSHSDVSYIACARKLMEMRDRIYPQFATHNAHTLAAVMHLGGTEGGYEVQRLHGMGEGAHDILVQKHGVPSRIYAPVGTHKDLLAYLVRRLLENGANSSFVNQIADLSLKPEEIATDPFADIAGPNAKIARPAGLYAPERRNSRGWDVNEPVDLAALEAMRAPFADHVWHFGSAQAVANPARAGDVVGHYDPARVEDVRAAAAAARNAAPDWAARPAKDRGAILTRAAELYEAHGGELMAILAREAGKTIGDCVSELREAVDFLRYYALEAERLAAPPRGVFACISPWNFPLAIFTGQIAAALSAGNAVLAKPAGQTPLIALRAVALLKEAGVPADVLHLLPGGGEIGAAVIAEGGADGVCFTGSTATAQAIHRSMADHLAPDAPLIAETGGLNAMIVDSTALPEQAVRDAVMSAFGSAGQRCSAARVLYVQEDIAAPFMEMLKGATAELTQGDPWQADTDLGPVIDQMAYDTIAEHVTSRADAWQPYPARGLMHPPTIIPVTGIEALEREVFGPVLHVATFKAGQLDRVIAQINGRGYGLTFGLHTRLGARIAKLSDAVAAGNLYVNRNQIGAVVGSQPFGGEGLSGTGPKAGGPHYMARFTQGAQGAVEGTDKGPAVTVEAVEAALAAVKPQKVTTEQVMPGPTGEDNRLRIVPKGRVLCLGPDVRAHVIAALAAGCGVVAVTGDDLNDLADAKLRVINGHVPAEMLADLSGFDVLAAPPTRAIRQALARRDGPILQPVTDPTAPTAFAHERHVCIDTTSSGGNVALLSQAG
ncbi:RHH-type proline utilization regulon transcriptional repressor/proline dehydrogenase/delta 1-pyrroline-5-carboxylate dehydrogenase [Rubricella aquisinus]|uniref:Bifunctional protein PutA n=1 Tax=Rubricella aquisinus TaxID=2028108 RepID=A0A840WXL4_9RHOB|nr:bifunctional proline dehydrogenase/L-glutamate gamma-semialdehyde dehydrogenase PutA [Rubricella aquisinus]MBB5515104.1 RHH-type proline utilization regulon transcriptional repressor/proline dehydrogenase/delta 1-pyrroline-5-carboxylate dehydrogenase [Rubricella aquisinus]